MYIVLYSGVPQALRDEDTMFYSNILVGEQSMVENFAIRHAWAYDNSAYSD